MNRELLIVAGPEKGRRFSIQDGQTLVIGRGQASDTQINDASMSRVHCHVEADGGTTRLVDRGSSSGTWIADEQISEHKLQPGDLFRIGNTEVRFQLESHGEATTISGQVAFGRPKPTPAIAPLQELVGQTIAHYRIESIIAPGNTGFVFRAHDTEKDRPAAMKVLTPDASQSEEQKERFIRAMKTMLPVKPCGSTTQERVGTTFGLRWSSSTVKA